MNVRCLSKKLYNTAVSHVQVPLFFIEVYAICMLCEKVLEIDVCFERLITIISNEKYFWKHCYKSILVNMQIELHVYCFTGSTHLKI